MAEERRRKPAVNKPTAKIRKSMENRKHEIVKASWIGIIGNALLSISKILIGLISGSLAVVGDGIDSATDIITSLVTLVTARFIAKPPDIKYPYGYEKADTIATKVLSFIIFFAGAQLCISTIQKIATSKNLRIPTAIAIYITIISILGKLALAFHQNRIGKKTHSSMLCANAKNMQNDVLISTGVLLGLFFTFILHLPLLDAVMALMVSVWIMKTAFGIFMQTTRDLMDGIKNPSIYDNIIEVIESVKGASNPHRMRLRKLGNMYMLEVDIEVDGHLTVYESHKISHQVEKNLRNTVKDIYDVVIHVEPAGYIETDEKFGVSKENIS